MSTPFQRPPDLDPVETREWVESLEAVLKHDGPDRARFLLRALGERAAREGIAPRLAGRYDNSIPVAREPAYPGDLDLEARLASHIRWNAMAMVVRANRFAGELGGHLSTYASAATLLEVGFHHHFRGHDHASGGDLVYFQGHASPGIYARAFLEGRLTEDALAGFRRELTTAAGVTSYPHPWLMRDFWQFATVSMGLGPLMAIYQARFLKHLQHRELLPENDRTVFAFLGDGEMDEPESLGALTVAGREHLDNLVFVVNCNLQRLDGPVRGNGSIVRELESLFVGAGWNVIKVLWGSSWDEYLQGPYGDALLDRMELAVDGDYQSYAADSSGRLMREHFFGADPRLAELAASLTDDRIIELATARGGHDPLKVHAAYAAARAHRHQPTVILAKTVKGYGLGDIAQARNATHQQKKLNEEAIRAYRTRLDLSINDEAADALPFVTPAEGSPESDYLAERRAALGGPVPERRAGTATLVVPELDTFASQLEGSGEREISTTMAFVRILATLLRDDELKARVVPIVADEARTFGMEGLFRQVGIYSPHGQHYTPVDREQLAYYREQQDGQILQEGISEGGAFSSWIAAATAYANHGLPMIPFYIYYSMFGLQRIGDLAWGAADMQARGFLLGATSGRTTLAGEGLQHQDGHSHLLASTIPNCRAYDPTYAYQLAVIMRQGLEQMVGKRENVFYYLTLLNENYPQPALPPGAEEGILRGMHRVRTAAKPQLQLFGAGSILREVEAAASLLADDHGVECDVWAITSFNELRRDGLAVRRWNRLHPGKKPRIAYLAQQLADRPGTIVAASDYMQVLADQLGPFVDRPVVSLGTDGFGRSDTRAALRAFFEVDHRHVAAAALAQLAREGTLKAAQVRGAMKKLGIDPDAPDPVTV